MTTVRIRVIGSETDTNSLIAELHGLDGVEHIEEVADLMEHMDDADSSSAGLTDDIGPGVHAIEVEVRDHVRAETIRRLAADFAQELDASLEFVDDF